MVADWRFTQPATVDVRLWLEDDKGNEVVYPAGTGPIEFLGRNSGDSTRGEHAVGTRLTPGVKYNVCVHVVNSPSSTPNIASPGVKGIQHGFWY